MPETVNRSAAQAHDVEVRIATPLIDLYRRSGPHSIFCAAGPSS